MNKSALRSFATNARRELLEKVKTKAMKIGVTEDKIKQADVESSDAIFIDGRQLSAQEKKQRQELIKRIEQKGFNQVMEEVAYTWFNRFTALRFMEVNEYLPSDVRVLSSSNPNDPIPDIIKEALSLDFEIDKEWVYERKLNNENDKLFQYLIIKQCNDLYDYLPFMFEKIDDYTEILFPEGLLSKDSLLKQMTDTESIPEDDWSNVEIIGWLYQYYIAEEKDRVFKAKKKYKSEEIPFATQLFTPDWIVRYMVQNSLGRYWIESHPEDRELINNWEFYLEKDEQESDFEEKIAPYINKELKVEDIKCFDPAMGSGHILVYMFDVLYQIYRKCGYQESEIPRLIIENNLYGLDIDDRAYQLASFSIVMKALEYNRHFLRNIKKNKLTLNVASIQEANIFNEDDISYILNEASGSDFNETKEFMKQFTNAKTIGSLLCVDVFPQRYLEDRLKTIKKNPTDDLFMNESREKTLRVLPLLIRQAKIMTNKYDVLVTNPPYMGMKYMNKELASFLKKNYPDSKNDTFASFMEVSQYLKKYSFLSMVNQHSWMFISSFQQLRNKIVNQYSIQSMLHLGARAFEEISGEVVQTTAFVLRTPKIESLKGDYIRLISAKNHKEKQIKAIEAIQNPSVNYRYNVSSKHFKVIEGSPIAYWISEKVRENFINSVKLGEIASPRKGNSTSDNKRFLRLWFEVGIDKINFECKEIIKEETLTKRWFPYNKGGGYRKWYGNNEFIIDWKNDGEEIRKIPTAVIANYDFFMKPGLTWSTITTTDFSIRKFGYGFIFDNGGCCLFTSDADSYYYLALLNSTVFKYLLGEINPTLNFQSGEVAKFPVKYSRSHKKEIDEISKSNYQIAKIDWDYSETSWDFQNHFLLKTDEILVENAFDKWENITESNLLRVKENEEELNRIFIEIYELQDELTPDVDPGSIKLRRPFKDNDIRSFISYAVGCMLGRYSLDQNGLVYAGGVFDLSIYQTFKADEDNILPIVDGPYFKDDIVSRFVDFVKVTFSEETLEENLDFIADALGRKKNETSRETIRRYFLNEFFKDHVQTYKKRPIYWQFTSGKQKAFNCLVYMHRYDPTLLGRIRTDYLHEVQTRMDAEKKDLLTIIEGDSTSKERNQAKKDLKTLEKKIEELKAYDEKLHHMADQQIEIDLDDGVEVNYAKFKDLLTKK